MGETERTGPAHVALWRIFGAETLESHPIGSRDARATSLTVRHGRTKDRIEPNQTRMSTTARVRNGRQISAKARVVCRASEGSAGAEGEPEKRLRPEPYLGLVAGQQGGNRYSINEH